MPEQFLRRFAESIQRTGTQMREWPPPRCKAEEGIQDHLLKPLMGKNDTVPEPGDAAGSDGAGEPVGAGERTDGAGGGMIPAVDAGVPGYLDAFAKGINDDEAAYPERLSTKANAIPRVTGVDPLLRPTRVWQCNRRRWGSRGL